MRVLITGGAGFLGRRVAIAASREKIDVLAVGRSPSTTPPPDSAELFRYLQLDVRDADRLQQLCSRERPDAVIHCAAPGVSRMAPTGDLVGEACAAAQALAQITRAHSVPVVWIGSCFEYAPSDKPIAETHPLVPATEYAKAKVHSWQLFQHNKRPGIPTLTLRPFHLYGPGENHARFIPSALLAPRGLAENRFGNALNTRDFVYVDDAASGIVSAAKLVVSGSALPQESLNLASGRGTTLAEAARLAAVTVGKPDFAYNFTGASPLPGYEPQILLGNPGLAAFVLGWAATTPPSEGLSLTWTALSHTSHSTQTSCALGLGHS